MLSTFSIFAQAQMDLFFRRSSRKGKRLLSAALISAATICTTAGFAAAATQTDTQRCFADQHGAEQIDACSAVDYDQAITIDPKPAFRYLDKAVALEELSQYDAAAATLSAGLALNPRNGDLLAAQKAVGAGSGPVDSAAGGQKAIAAGQPASQIWFQSLDSATRLAVQADLTLAGFYNALIDGNFGAATFAALQAYQRSIGDPATGVLNPKELSALEAEAASVSTAFGLQRVDDTAAGLEISVPTKLLPTRVASANGTNYQSPGAAFALQTSHISASDPEAFNALFQERDASSPSRTIEYSHLGASSFTVTGSFDGRSFYDRFYKVGLDAVGFTLTWDKSDSARGAILAAYLASFSRPLSAKAVAQPPAPTADIVQLPAKSGDLGASIPPAGSEVPLKLDGGTYVVPVLINGALTLDFTVDSGAADVSIPADVVLTLVRTGTITPADFLGTQTYTLADGSTVPSQTFRIRSLKVGDRVIENVVGSVASVKGSLLLGQSFLSRFSSWSMDNNRHALVLGSIVGQGAGDQSATGYQAPTAAAAAPGLIGHGGEDRSISTASAPPPPIAQKTPRLALYGGLDFYGNDIRKERAGDLAQCGAACLGNNQCQAFTFNANPDIRRGPNCFLKDRVNRLEAYSLAIGGLVLGPGESAPQYSFAAIDPTKDLLTNRDLPGGDLSASPYSPARTLDGCRMACIDNQACEAFSFVRSLHQCWLKGSAGIPRFARGVVSGTKRHLSVAPASVINLAQ